MKIRIITVGKLKNSALSELERDFLTQLKKYVTPDIHTVNPESVPDERAKEAREKEGKRILKLLNNEQNEIIVALNEHGNQFTSVGFAEFLERRKDLNENITFIIGGSFGLSKEVIKKADNILALSEMTFFHEMIYILLLEQISRAFSIISGSKYHK